MKKNDIINQNSVLYGALFMLIFLTSSFVVTNKIISPATIIGLCFFIGNFENRTVI